GLRIELGEIESTLEKHPTVQQAVVLAREDVPGDKRLVAYVRAQAGGEPEPAALREYLKQRLPTYMVPASFVVLAHFPMLASGKVDRRRLPPPSQVGAAPATDFVAPSTPMELELAKLWTQLLGVERPGALDGFFVLGGHSLLAARACARIREEWNVDLSLKEFFENPTLRDMAVLILQRQALAADTDVLAQLLEELES
ncbi:MAG: AMP-binding enzyme, partial [Hyalangium sp.]|uniref:AMP-binding enzyme n=1 Tax=Hyalangium sp. TaxID=2028555 RepID=UPI00389A8A1F